MNMTVNIVQQTITETVGDDEPTSCQRTIDRDGMTYVSVAVRPVQAASKRNEHKFWHVRQVGEVVKATNVLTEETPAHVLLNIHGRDWHLSPEDALVMACAIEAVARSLLK